MNGVRIIALAALVAFGALLAGPRDAAAQEPTPEPGQSLSEALEELRSGAEALLRGLIEDIEPHLREIEPKVEEIGPRLRALAERLGGLAAYHPPEVLPNGDIILRRRVPLDAHEPEPSEDAPPDDLAPDDLAPDNGGADSDGDDPARNGGVPESQGAAPPFEL